MWKCLFLASDLLSVLDYLSMQSLLSLNVDQIFFPCLKVAQQIASHNVPGK